MLWLGWTWDKGHRNYKEVRNDKNNVNNANKLITTGATRIATTTTIIYDNNNKNSNNKKKNNKEERVKRKTTMSRIKITAGSMELRAVLSSVCKAVQV